MQTLWYAEQPEHHGRFVDFAGVDAHPRPVQRPIPLVVGGHTPAAYRRAVSRGHGWYGFGMPPEAAAASLEGLRAGGRPGRPPGRARRAGDHGHAAWPAHRRDGEQLRRCGVHRLVVIPNPKDDDVRPSIDAASAAVAEL